jgi:enamidase
LPSILIHNLGGMVTGDWRQPLSKAESIYIEDGVIREIGSRRDDADTIIDAYGLLATPGLIDTHVHPTFGDFTPTQNSVGWMRSYMHGGVTSLVSAGELHVPGLPLDPPDAKLFKYLAVLARRCSQNLGPDGPRLFGGALLLAPGLEEGDFNEIAEAGIRCVKFIFYPYGANDTEAENYVRWSKERGIVVKIHSGGVSRSGVSRPAGIDVVRQLEPDVVGHIAGGPIPMPPDEMMAIVTESDAYLEIATGGSFRRAIELMEVVNREGAHDRVILGSDTPSGTGVTPRAMLRNVALLASLCNVSPEVALCMATGNAAIAHRLDAGFLTEGKPADLLLMGKITGSVGKGALDCLSIGDIPGISTVIVGGRVTVAVRSEQTPPPEKLAVIEKSPARFEPGP